MHDHHSHKHSLVIIQKTRIRVRSILKNNPRCLLSMTTRLNIFRTLSKLETFINCFQRFLFLFYTAEWLAYYYIIFFLSTGTRRTYYTIRLVKQYRILTSLNGFIFCLLTGVDGTRNVSAIVSNFGCCTYPSNRLDSPMEINFSKL